LTGCAFYRKGEEEKLVPAFMATTHLNLNYCLSVTKKRARKSGKLRSISPRSVKTNGQTKNPGRKS